MTDRINHAVPVTEADLTQAWLSAALERTFPQATFASLEHQRIGEDYGFASHILRCR